MTEHNFFLDLETIHYKYERLTALIDILRMVASTVIEVSDMPEDGLENALYEIELGMEENNDRLKKLFRQKGGAK